MDFMTMVRILLRRWYVVILGLALSATAANAVMNSIAPTYKTLGSVLIVAPSPPRIAGQQVDAMSLNPFTRFSAATTVLATVTVQIMDDVEVRERLAAEGAVPDYQVGIAPDQTPIVYVTVVNENEELAVKANALILESINKELDRRQAIAGAPEESRVRSLVITEPSRGVELVGGRIRAVLAVAVLGLAASLSTAFVVEGFAQSRARRRAGVGGSRRGKRGERDATSDRRERRRSRKQAGEQALEPAGSVDAPAVDAVGDEPEEVVVVRADGRAGAPAGVRAAEQAADAVEPAGEPAAAAADVGAVELALEPDVDTPVAEEPPGRPALEPAIEAPPRKRARRRAPAVEPPGEAAVEEALEAAVERPVKPASEPRRRATAAMGGSGTRRRAPAVKPDADAVVDEAVVAAVRAAAEAVDRDSGDDGRAQRDRQRPRFRRGSPRSPTDDDADT